ncbi:MAG: class I SAM-dependent methyltransferase [Nanoarchaeota archaeon]
MNPIEPFAFTRIDYVINLIAPHKKQRILHIGVSNIPDIEKLVENTVAESVTVDIDKEKIEKARSHVTKARILEDDIMRPAKLKKGHFDVVVMLEVLEHLKDDVGALNTIHRLLKKGGHLIISVPNKDLRHVINPVKYFEHERHYSNEDIIEKLRGAGFGIEHFNVVESFSLLANLYLHIIMKFLLRKNVPFNFFDRHHNKTYAQYNRHGLDIILKARKI